MPHDCHIDGKMMARRVQETKNDLRQIAASRFRTSKCERQDLNLHELPHWILSLVRKHFLCVGPAME
jgi:hypothetical protein